MIKLLLIGSLFLIHPAEAASVDDVMLALRQLDVASAANMVEQMGAASSSDPNEIAIAAEVAFYQGDYATALTLMTSAVDAGYADTGQQLDLMRSTVESTDQFDEQWVGTTVVRYRRGVDVILVEDAVQVIDGANQHIVPLLGEQPPRALLEIYPTGTAFIGASSLPAEAVQTTGVVALSKWSRLLVTTPRALGRGYGWRDTVAHEYIHQIVSHNSGNRAPVWLQEGIAKYLEHKWRGADMPYQMPIRSSTLLADALESDTLVSFEQMHPSLALLPTAEMAALAYAQLASLVEFSLMSAGDDVLRDCLQRIAVGADPRDALAGALGLQDFADVEANWREYALGLKLVRGKSAVEGSVVLDGADDFSADPVLSSRADLARWLRIGDLLQAEGHNEAALIEYQKAVVAEQADSPLLSNRIAAARLKLGQVEKAREVLEDSLRYYPEYAGSYKTLGRLYRQNGSKQRSFDAYLMAAGLSPFDPVIQAAVVDLAQELNEDEVAVRHQRYLTILRRGGED